MAQVTIYIDNNLEENIKKLAKNTGESISKFISKILEQNISSRWDSDIKNLSGSWSDFPTIEYTENIQVKDTKREEF